MDKKICIPISFQRSKSKLALSNAKWFSFTLARFLIGVVFDLVCLIFRLFVA